MKFEDVIIIKFEKMKKNEKRIDNIPLPPTILKILFYAVSASKLVSINAGSEKGAWSSVHVCMFG